MSEIKAVYRSSNPDNIVRLQATEAAALAVRPLRDAFYAEFPGSTLYMNSDGVIDSVYFPTMPDMAVWKKRQGRDSWLKYQPRAKGGEAMTKRLRQMSAPHRTSFDGMPDYAGLFSRPGYRLVGDTVWMVWSVEPEQIERSAKFNKDLWERMKISDYYVMLESLPPEEPEIDL